MKTNASGYGATDISRSERALSRDLFADLCTAF
jgi:hypothetical protein